jgi:Cysteine-rich CWC
MKPSAADRCPRCGGKFRCGIADAGPCPCSAVSLSATLQQQLRAQFSGCLCLPCLQALAAGAPLQGPGRESPGQADGTALDHGAPQADAR